jgi:hypothetical protein
VNETLTVMAHIRAKPGQESRVRPSGRHKTLQHCLLYASDTKVDDRSRDESAKVRVAAEGLRHPLHSQFLAFFRTVDKVKVN